MGENQESKKERIQNWLKEPSNLVFLLIVVGAIAIRLYYFSLTKNQPLWWDEADYMAYAKNLAGLNSDWIATSKHNTIFSFIAAFLFNLSLSESSIKFLLEILPSIFLVPLTYFLVIEMYADKRIALISSFVMAFLWDILFNSMRFHLEAPALFAGLLAIFIFWQGHEKKKKLFGYIDAKWAIPLAVVFSVLSYALRRGYFLFGLFILIYLLFTKNIKSLAKEKYNWVGLGIAIFLFVLAEKFIFIAPISSVAASYTHSENSIDLSALGVFPEYFSSGGFLKDIWLYLFWIGFAIILIRLFLVFGQIRKENAKEGRSDIFAVISIVSTILFFTLILRSQGTFGESRWYFPLLLGTVISISKSTVLIADYLKRYHKFFAVGFVGLVLVLGGYYQIKHTDFIIKDKLSSFEGIKQASQYVKSISDKEDIIISVPVPQTIYYSERKVYSPHGWLEWKGRNEDSPMKDLFNKIESEPRARFLFVSFSEPNHPIWMKKIDTNQNGQVIGWEIPFMDTKVDFVNNIQDIKRTKTFEEYGLTFNLLDVKQDSFVYEITHN